MERAASLAYAQEVYAGCATIGFTDGLAARLKALLDRLAEEGGGEAAEAELVAAAKAAHLAAAERAAR